MSYEYKPTDYWRHKSVHNPPHLIDDADSKAFGEFVDRRVRTMLLRNEAEVKAQFAIQNHDMRLLYGGNPDNWPAGSNWEMHKQRSMWLCELRAREIDPDERTWVRYPHEEKQ